jgi:hypothetical protein
MSMHQIVVLNQYVADLYLFGFAAYSMPEVNLFHSSELIFFTY